MAKEKESGFQLQSITIGRKLNFSYQRSNPNHEKHKDQYQYKCADKWHPDLEQAVEDLVEKYVGELGFPMKNDAWSGFQPRKIMVRGLRVSVDFKIQLSWADEDDTDKLIETKGIFIDGLGEYVKTLVGEAQEYIDGRKRKQGDLFQNKNAFIGKKLRKKSGSKTKEEKAVEDHKEAIADA